MSVICFFFDGENKWRRVFRSKNSRFNRLTELMGEFDLSTTQHNVVVFFYLSDRDKQRFKSSTIEFVLNLCPQYFVFTLHILTIGRLCVIFSVCELDHELCSGFESKYTEVTSYSLLSDLQSDIVRCCVSKSGMDESQLTEEVAFLGHNTGFTLRS